MESTASSTNSGPRVDQVLKGFLPTWFKKKRLILVCITPKCKGTQTMVGLNTIKGDELNQQFKIGHKRTH